MKQIPFKCREKHITIKTFSSYPNNPTPSLIVCEECLKEVTEANLRILHKNNILAKRF